MSMNLIDKIKQIHQFSEIKGNTLFLRNKIKGVDLEKIIEIWDGSLYVESVTGSVNLPKEVKTIITSNKGTVSGDLSNVEIRDISNKKKLKKNRRKLYKKS